MNRPRMCIVFLFFFIATFGCSQHRTQEKKKPPNLLFIMTDQQRFDALSFAGNTVLKTPNMDRLAKEGVYFKNAYTQCAVCTPSRAAMLTGMTVANTKVISNRLAYEPEASGIMPMKTYDEVLAENGYEAEYYGKWHTPTFRAKIYNNPVTVAGRSVSELGPGKKAVYLDHLEDRFPELDPTDNQLMDTYTDRPYWPHPLDKRWMLKQAGEDYDIKVGQSDIHGITTIPAEHHISVVTATKVMDALERLKDKPFSITASFHHPHPPYLAAEEFIKLYPPQEMVPPVNMDYKTGSPYWRDIKQASEVYSDPEQIKYFISEYYALVKEVDYWVGEILNKVDELGLAENTLVVYTSDHGEMLGSHGLRGKFNFYEESSHVPIILRFPGKIDAGTIVKSPVSTINLFATILDYLQVPSAPKADGESLRGLIEGVVDKDTYVVTEWLTSLNTKPAYMVVKGGWKLMLPHPTGKNVMTGLYNLNQDPHEMTNLVADERGAEKYKTKVDELDACFTEWIQKTTKANH
jgi:arylsulfatase A-like enzyme